MTDQFLPTYDEPGSWQTLWRSTARYLRLTARALRAGARSRVAPIPGCDDPRSLQPGIIPTRRRPKLADLHRRIFGSPLKGPLARLDDQLIDAELDRFELRRRDLFAPTTLVTGYRGEISRMIAALAVDLDAAVRDRWNDLKRADARCAACPTAGICMAWLKGDCSAVRQPLSFCPNAPLFAEFMDRRSIAYDPIACRPDRHRGTRWANRRRDQRGTRNDQASCRNRDDELFRLGGHPSRRRTFWM